MKKLLICLMTGIIVLVGYGTSPASVQSEIEKAGKEGKNVFLVVSEPGATGSNKILATAKLAHKSAAKSTAVVEMNRSDSSNRQVVAKYRLSGAPLPLILLIASNGLPVGSLQVDQASPEKLVKMIPSPKKMEVMDALNQNRTVFLVASRKTMPAQSEAFDTCRSACSLMNDRAVLVSIDMDNRNEVAFLEKLGVNTSSSIPVIYVINPRGQITARFNSSVNSAQLIQASTKRAGGCCGGNSSCEIPKKKE